MAQEVSYHPPMPELPDVCVYLEALERKVAGQRLERMQLLSPFLLCSFEERSNQLEQKLRERGSEMQARV